MQCKEDAAHSGRVSSRQGRQRGRPRQTSVGWHTQFLNTSWPGSTVIVVVYSCDFLPDSSSNSEILRLIASASSSNSAQQISETRSCSAAAGIRRGSRGRDTAAASRNHQQAAWPHKRSPRLQMKQGAHTRTFLVERDGVDRVIGDESERLRQWHLAKHVRTICQLTHCNQIPQRAQQARHRQQHQPLHGGRMGAGECAHVQGTVAARLLVAKRFTHRLDRRSPS